MPLLRRTVVRGIEKEGKQDIREWMHPFFPCAHPYVCTCPAAEHLGSLFPPPAPPGLASWVESTVFRSSAREAVERVVPLGCGLQDSVPP